MQDRIELIDVLAHRSVIGERIDRRVADVVAHGKFINGPEVAEFEAAVTAFVGSDDVRSIGCANGTDALVLAMQVNGLQPGDGVICPSFTFVATAEAVAILGGQPIFADVENNGFNLSPESVRLAAKQAEAAGIPVKGICAVDLFGVPADYDALASVADELGCWVLADAAQAFGAERDGVRAGAMATVTTTSFFPAKPLGCYGDGGMIFTKDGDKAEEIVSLQQHGKGTEKYDNVRIGQNSRLDTIQAALLLVKLEVLAGEIKRRQEIADRYRTGLERVVEVPADDPRTKSAWAQYTVITDRREHLRAALNDANIGNAIYYPRPLHQQSGYRQFHESGIDLPRSTALAAQVISLPMHPYLTDAQVDRVVETVAGALS